jgi:chorismate synthase
MSSVYGKNLIVSIFGQSHSEAIGVCIDGLPAGKKIDFRELKKFMGRRSPGKNEYSTKRNEKDDFEVLSGIVNDTTCGAPFAAIIRNMDARSSDYKEIMDIPRPSHADFTAQMKYKGAQDINGGGHFSGRLTAPLCIAGGICRQMLKHDGIEIKAHISEIHGIKDSLFDPVNIDMTPLDDGFPVLDKAKGEKMISAIDEAKKDDDSLGGIIECAICGLPAGIGEPIFDGMENRISSAIFGIPAVKGIEFGNGFACSKLKGSQNNDGFYINDNKIMTKTNNSGGILGGISSGMPILFRVAIKPTPSIAKAQDSVSMSKMENTELVIKGRHDPCIVQRAVPCVEAAAAIAVMDLYIEYTGRRI